MVKKNSRYEIHEKMLTWELLCSMRKGQKYRQREANSCFPANFCRSVQEVNFVINTALLLLLLRYNLRQTSIRTQTSRHEERRKTTPRIVDGADSSSLDSSQRVKKPCINWTRGLVSPTDEMKKIPNSSADQSNSFRSNHSVINVSRFTWTKIWSCLLNFGAV